MRPNVLISILFVLGVILSVWRPGDAAMALPHSRTKRTIYIITHKPKKSKHPIIITGKPAKITDIYLRR
uniref:Venom peptide ECTX1-Rm64a n=1 Tax=Rhytidoponera metallica TaxID=148364 RepID=A0A8U0LU62_RHYMT|nr:venom peptide precursor ECTX1-Rm64a [Rhytidoponera metallica]